MAANPMTFPGKRIPTEDDRRELHRAFTAWTCDPVVADDLVQETLFAACNSQRQPGSPEEWRPWLFGVARNILLRWKRDVVKHGQRTAPAPESERQLIAASRGSTMSLRVIRSSRSSGADAALTISHRLGPARNADRILMMEHGRIVECGTHDDLMARNGRYAEMFLAQSGWYK